MTTQEDHPPAALASTELQHDEAKVSTTSTSQDGEHDASNDVEEKHEQDATPKRSKGKITLIMIALMLAVFLAALDVTIITTALPTISEEFDSIGAYTWVGSAFLLANAASIPSWGKISDIFGRKPMLLLANIIFMVGSLVAALSYSIGMLIAARAVQGLGAGGLVILVNICIGDLFNLRVRGAFYGLVGGVWAFASAIGPIIGGALTQKVTWRWCFYINLPLDGLAFFILLFFLDIKTPQTHFIDGLKAIDWVGSLLIVGGTLMFLFGLQYGGVTYPWSSAIVVCLLVFGVITFALFALWEWRIPKYPVMPLGLFSSITNLATLTVVFVHGVVFISGSYYLPLYFQAARGATPILSGVYLLPTCLALSVGSIATGITIAKTGKFRPVIWAGLVLMTLGFGLFIDLPADASWAKLIIYQIIAGLGIGPLFQAPIIALQAHINPRDVGTATATLGFVRQLATTTGVVIGQVLFQNQMSGHYNQLVAAVGPGLGASLAAGAAGAETQTINALPDGPKSVVQNAVASSLQTMWIMFTVISGFGLVIAFIIKKRVLTREHKETETGLEAERENAAARKAERDAKRQSKAIKHGASRPTTGHESDGAVSTDLEKAQ